VLDWTKTKAYKLGLIDEDGKKLKSPETDKEKKAYTFFHRVVFNIKRLFEKLPGDTARKIATYAAALKLLKEEIGMSEEAIIEVFEEFIVDLEKEDLTESNDSELLINHQYVLNKSIPIRINESTDVDAPKSTKVVILSKNDKPEFGQIFYKAKHILSDQIIHITKNDVHENTAAASVTTADVAIVPKPLKMPNGEKYQKFKVNSNIFNKIISGRNKYQRWNKYLDLANEQECMICNFAKKYRDATIIIEDETTGNSRAYRP
jgi:hypothetical protein